MARRPEPIYLGRETYRRRRLIDAIRLMPVVGGLLFLGPLLGASGAPRSTALGGLYIFVAWFGLIVLSAFLVRRLGRAPGGFGADPFEREPGGRSASAAAGADGAEDVAERDRT